MTTSAPMTDDQRCPTCGQELPEALRTVRRRTLRNADAEPLRTNRRRSSRNASDDSLRKARRRDSRNNLKVWWRHRTGNETGCVMCGAELPRRVRSNRMFCSNACRQRAYRIRRKVERE